MINSGGIFILDFSNLLLLIPVVIGLVMVVRWLQGRASTLVRIRD
jgi:hypothetical protein